MQASTHNRFTYKAWGVPKSREVVGVCKCKLVLITVSHTRLEVCLSQERW